MSDVSFNFCCFVMIIMCLDFILFVIDFNLVYFGISLDSDCCGIETYYKGAHDTNSFLVKLVDLGR